MSIELYDAHLHLADPSLAEELQDVKTTYSEIGLRKAIVVGTSPQDWFKVIEICRDDERFMPAIGLHPWEVKQAADGWQDKMLHLLDSGVSVVGEIGLDQWIQDHDIEKQKKAFQWQLSAASERNLPTTIHCLKAHQPTIKVLRSSPLPERGFKLHAYNGPADTIKPLLDLGAYFSFNAGQFKPNARRVYEIIAKVPDDRLLVETDAPNFPLPRELREFNLNQPELSHPGNLRVGYRELARLKNRSMEDLAKIVADNFERYFLTTD